jgi:hypothetical protein
MWGSAARLAPQDRTRRAGLRSADLVREWLRSSCVVPGEAAIERRAGENRIHHCNRGERSGKGRAAQSRGSRCYFFLWAKLRIPAAKRRLQFLIQDLRAHLQQQVRAFQRPVHLLFLHESSAHHLVDRRLHERRTDPPAVPMALPEVRYELAVVTNVGQ